MMDPLPYVADPHAPQRGDAVRRVSGIVLFSITVLVVLAEWTGWRPFSFVAGMGTAVYLAIVAVRVAWSGRVFVGIGLALTTIAIVVRPDWSTILVRALNAAAFVGAFYVSLAWLRTAAATSPTIEACGRFLAEQRPGRRYLALTTGGHLFGLVLNLGAIPLLGGLAEGAARREADAEIRAIRTRRMLLAIQRGFIATLCWSPLSFSVAITTTVVPGATWSGAVGYGLVSAAVLVALGWSLDTLFKPKPSRPPAERPPPAGSWGDLAPLIGLLVLLMAGVGGLQVAAGLRAVAAVMIVAPTVSLGWIALQGKGGPCRRLGHMGQRATRYVVHELFEYRGDLVLLTMAGFIGTLGAALIGPATAGTGLDISTIPAWMIPIGLLWMVPLAGQVGLNPILAVSLVAPLLPDAGALGIPPAAIVVAITGGWALSGASSPFTATTLFLGALARIDARRVGLGWNGLFTLLGGAILSLWVTIVARL